VTQRLQVILEEESEKTCLSKQCFSMYIKAMRDIQGPEKILPGRGRARINF
jgi:hypothetical protein